MQNLEHFLTLENAIQYNNLTDKLIFIADELDISALGKKVFEIENMLCDILIANGITPEIDK
tara:strand:+ start:18 stop:203 length:186 start_codon:yes stop_codon:yes gene_type:complete